MIEIKYDNKFDHLLKLQRTCLNKYDIIPFKIINKIINQIYNEIDKFISPETIKWLDIGAGLGLINILIYQKYQPNIDDCKIYLLDRSVIEYDKRMISFGKKDDFAFYNNFDLSREILELNGIPSNCLYYITPDQFNLDHIKNIKFDLIMSRCSWCYHYPFNTYSNMVYNLLDDDGIILVDCRKKHYFDLIKDDKFIWKIIKKMENDKGFLILGKKDLNENLVTRFFDIFETN